MWRRTRGLRQRPKRNQLLETERQAIDDQDIHRCDQSEIAGVEICPEESCDYTQMGHGCNGQEGEKPRTSQEIAVNEHCRCNCEKCDNSQVGRLATAEEQQIDTHQLIQRNDAKFPLTRIHRGGSSF